MKHFYDYEKRTEKKARITNKNDHVKVKDMYNY